MVLSFGEVIPLMDLYVENQKRCPIAQSDGYYREYLSDIYRVVERSPFMSWPGFGLRRNPAKHVVVKHT